MHSQKLNGLCTFATLFLLITLASHHAAYCQSAPIDDDPSKTETKPHITEIRSEPWRISKQLRHSFNLGGLDYRGGLVLSGVARDGKNDFGGFSGLSVSPEGKKLSIVSDRGTWYEMDVILDASDSLSKVSESFKSGTLKDLSGKQPLTQAESIAHSAAYGFLVSFDNNSVVYRFRNDLDSVPTSFAPKISLNGFQVSNDDAFEAFAANSTGMYLISEKIPSASAAGNRSFFVPFKNVNAPVEFVFQTVQVRDSPTRSVHLQPSGATFLSDGSLIVLSRHFFSSQNSPHRGQVAVGISRIPANKLTPASLTSAPVVSGSLLYLNVSAEFDNFEAVSSFRRNGQEFIYCLSDDNQSKNGPQKTILALFQIRSAIIPSQQVLTSGSATQALAIRCYEIAKNRTVDEASRVSAIEQLTSATIPATDLIGNKQVHLALIDLLNQPNASYEIRYQTARALIKRYAMKNDAGQGVRQSTIIDGLATFAKRPTTPPILRKYILKNLVLLAQQKASGGM